MTDNEALWHDCKDDFRNLLYLIWEYQPDIPGPPSLVQYDIADFLQSDDRDAIVVAARGFGKTYIGCAFAIWYLMNNPNHSVQIVSASEITAKKFVRMVKTWIEKIPVLAPMRTRKGQKNQEFMFDVGTRTTTDKDASVYAVGVGGAITGTRINLLIADDIEIPKNSRTQVERDRLYELVKEFSYMRQPNDSKIVWNGTPHSEESLYFKIAQKSDNIVLRRWPARYPSLNDPDLAPNLSPTLAQRIQSGEAEVGEPTFPERFDADNLTETEAREGKTSFLMQMMLCPRLADEMRHPLKLRDLMVADIDMDEAPVRFKYQRHKTNIADIPSVGFGKDGWFHPDEISLETAPFEDSILHVDPSGKGEDECAWTIVKMLCGNLFVAENGAFKNGYDEHAQHQMLKRAFEHGVNRIVVESNFGDTMYSQLLRPKVAKLYKELNQYEPKKKMPPSVEDRRVTGQKEKRICDTLEPLFNSHKVIVHSSCAEDKELWTQAVRITRDKGCLRHDDRIDSLAGACSYFQERMNIDQEHAVKRATEDKHNAYVTDWLNKYNKSSNRSLVNSRTTTPKYRMRGVI